MSKENRSLIINLGVFLLIGIIFLISISQYNKAKQLKAYKEYFSEATNLKKKSLDEKPLTEEITIYKGKNVIGYVYVGLDYAEDIPGHEHLSLLKLEVVVDNNKKIIEVVVLEHEHTPSCFTKVEEYLPTLKGVILSDYRDVDEVAGASEFSMPIVRDILNKVTVLQTGKEPNPPTEKDPDVLYKEIYDGFDSREEDETFEATDLVIKKEVIKDEDEEVIGYAYTLQGTTKEFLDKDYKKEYGELTLLVGLDLDNKVVGIRTVETTHTGVYYNKYQEEYDELVGVELVGDVNVDLVAGSTVSGNSIQELIDALKEVINNG
ncbi:MAG TPA: hypothetical protein GX001_04015 [Acholeplasmataceae bacterium]|nr:hypothetical protein [Acholeplasmataceae bacterium]